MSSVETEKAVEVRPGNLVRPWTWVTWQVHVGIHLTIGNPSARLVECMRERQTDIQAEREKIVSGVRY